MFIGDIVGKVGRSAVEALIAKIADHDGFDFCVANCENAAGGFGVTPAIVEQLLALGIDVLTSGNHVWDRKEVFDIIDKERRLLRPANYPEEVPGRGSTIEVARSGRKVAVINLSGRIFVDTLDCPFKAADREIEKIKPWTNIIIVDMHAEATSEKMAMAWYLDGRVSAVIGTHTHVQTADERVLPQGTVYLSDVGMTGPLDAVIGVEKEMIIQRFLTQLPRRFESAKGEGLFSAAIIDIEENSGLATNIRRLLIRSKGGVWGNIESNSLMNNG